MFQPLYVAATGLAALEEEILNITNNLANAKTVAFKKARTELESLFFIEKSFKDILYETISSTSTPPVAVEFGTGVRVSSTPKDFAQGQIETTNNPLDLAIQGEGFFPVKMPDGSIAYTRAGNFHLDNERNLVDVNGHLFEPEIVFPENVTSVTIYSDGTIAVIEEGSSDLTEVGQINLARFTNSAGLKSIGQNLYQATEASGEAISGLAGDEGFGTIAQYALEQSNVDVISEMMRMVTVQRVFETVSKAVQTYEAILTSTLQMKS